MIPPRASSLAGVLTLLLAFPVLAEAPEEEAMRRRALVHEAAGEATLIVTGEILTARAVLVDEGRKIMTLARLRVDRRFRSLGPVAALADETVELVFPGGVIGELAQRVGGVPLLEVGDRLLLFLRVRPGQSPSGARRWTPTLLGLSIWRLDGEVAHLEPAAVRRVRRELLPPGDGKPLRLPLSGLPSLLEKSESGP